MTKYVTRSSHNSSIFIVITPFIPQLTNVVYMLSEIASTKTFHEKTNILHHASILSLIADFFLVQNAHLKLPLSIL